MLIGCGSSHPDVTPDSPPIPRCETWTFAPHLFDPCAVPDGTIDVQLTRFEQGYKLDGATGVFYRGETDVEFTVPRISIDGISILSMDRLVIGRDAGLSVMGPEPVVLVVWEAVEALGGLTSVPSDTRIPAAGSPASECLPPTAGSGQSGAGGGGFQGHGGVGGLGDSGAGGAGGVALALPDRLTAGCDGADGTTAGSHGVGGGGLAVVARTSISIQRVVSVGGGQGSGVGGPEAGAGGGSGGMLELEAPLVTITASAEIFACGGPGQFSNPVTNPCLALDGIVGVPADETGSSFGGGGSGGAGFLVLRAHDEAIVDPLATIAPAFAIR